MEKSTVVHCTYDPETKQGSGFTGRKVKGTNHIGIKLPCS